MAWDPASLRPFSLGQGAVADGTTSQRQETRGSQGTFWRAPFVADL